MRNDTPRSWGGLQVAELSVAQMQERKPENKWLDPRFLAQSLGILVTLVSIAIGSYVFASSRATKLEIVGVQLAQQATEIKNSQAQIALSVQQVTNVVYALQAKLDAQAHEIEDLKRAKELHDAYMVLSTNKIAKLEAKLEK